MLHGVNYKRPRIYPHFPTTYLTSPALFQFLLTIMASRADF